MNFLEGAFDGGGGPAITIGKRRIAIPGTPALSSLGVGGKILLGIRPEHLRWRPTGAEDESAIQAKVELVERLEPESYIVVSPVDPAVVIRSAETESELAQADAQV